MVLCISAYWELVGGIFFLGCTDKELHPESKEFLVHIVRAVVLLASEHDDESNVGGCRLQVPTYTHHTIYI